MLTCIWASSVVEWHSNGLELVLCFLNTNVFKILKVQCWTFNIHGSVNIEYWIFRCILQDNLSQARSVVKWHSYGLEGLPFFMSTHVFIILKLQYWIFNTWWNLNIEYWISENSFRSVVLSKVSCWVAQLWFGETALFSEYSCIYNFESTMNIQYYSWKWLCKESCIELG